MVVAHIPCVVGVDGGGSSCRIALLREGRRHEAEVGAANVSTDCDAAIASLRDGLARVAAAAGLSMDDLRPCAAYLGLAGVKGAEDAARVAAALPFERVRVEDDRLAAVAGALGEADGAVAGIGTGSFLARRSGGTVRLIGGWGLALGDEASAAWLGRGLLSAVLKTVDGLVEPSPLTEAIFAEHGRDPEAIVAFSLNARPRDYGRLAPRIDEAAQAGDALATHLMRAGAAYIEEALRALGWQHGETLCLVGGVARHYARYLGEEIAPSLKAPKGTALDGALQLAARVGGAA
ncbi:MAG: ATPase [Paracoccaceae bacterium]|nr:ATPase [Paracoccaceae bacterium]